MGGSDCMKFCEPCDLTTECNQAGKTQRYSKDDGAIPPLGPGPDTILIPIFIDERDYCSSKKRRSNGDGDDDEKAKQKNSLKKKRPRAKSRELRGGVLYMGCDCEKRNGLQDDCRRTGCQGSPECLHIPPTCGPSAFSSGKHLVKMSEAWKAKHNVY